MYFSGDRETAHAMLEECLEIFRAEGDKYGLAMGLGLKGGFLSWLEQELGRDFWPGLSLEMIGFGLIRAGYIREAVENFKECQSLFGDNGAPITLIGWAEVASALGQSEQAARLLAAGGALAPGYFRKHQNVELERAVELLRKQIDAATFEAAWLEGQAMTVEQAMQEAGEIAAKAEEFPDRRTPTTSGLMA